jgi:hypothetical protein
MMTAFWRECVFLATKLAEKTLMLVTAPHRFNQSLGRVYQRGGAAGKEQTMHEGQIGPRSAPRRRGKLEWGLLLLMWFAGNFVVATLAWFLVSMLLR